jgi:hypothetical protein
MAVLAVLFVVGSADRPWVKRRVQALARAASGIELDYASARIGLLSGADVDDLVVRTPEGMRAVVPDFLRVRHVSARWSWRSLFGRGPQVESLAISDVTITVVADESGRTSLDALMEAAPPSAPMPTVPLSRKASRLETALPLGWLDLERVTVVWLRTEHGATVERTELRGLAATMSTKPSDLGGSQVRTELGSRSAPLDLAFARERRGDPAGGGRAALWVEATVSPTQLVAALDVRVLEQTLAPEASINHSVHAEAGVHFDPSRGRTEITVHDTQAGEGATTLEASIEVPDSGSAVVRHAQGDVDVARLLEWLPPGLVPASVGRARVVYRIDGLSTGPVLHLGEGGAATIDLDAADVKAGAEGSRIELDGIKLSVHAQPGQDGAIAARGTVAFAGHLDAGGQRVRADEASLDFEGQQARGGAFSGRAGLRVANLAAAGPSPTEVRAARLEIKVRDLDVRAAEPLATRGDVAVSFAADSLETGAAGAHATVRDLVASAHAGLDGHAPYAAEVDAAGSRLRVAARDGATLLDAPARLKVDAREAFVDLDHPASSRGVVHAEVAAGDVAASLDLTKGKDALEYALRAAAPSLRALRPFASPAQSGSVPWETIGAKVRSTGRLQNVAGPAPWLEETTELEVDRPALGELRAKSLSLTLHSRGSMVRHDADLDLRAQAVRLPGADEEEGREAADAHLTLSAAVDRDRRSLHAELGGEGLLSAKGSVTASFDAGRRAVPYDLDVHLAGLRGLAPVLSKVHGLEGVDTSQLELALSSRGALIGLVTEVGRDGTVRLEPHPSRTAGVEGQVAVHASHVRWRRADDEIATPALAWRADLHAGDGRRTAESHLELEALHLGFGPKELDLTGVRDDSTLTARGDLVEPTLEFAQHTTIEGVRQNVAPEYPIGDVAYAVQADREPNGLIHVDDLKFTNGAGGTSLGLSGNLELGAGRHTLSLTASMEQKLAPLSRAPERFAGAGVVALEANVISPNMSLIRLRASVKAHDVSVTLPRAGIDVKSANGEVPITMALDVGKEGVVVRREATRSPYSMLRFADQHPLLNRSGFLSIASIKSPFANVAPLVGNVAVEQRTISLRQFEMGIRGGTVTGQCGIDWDGPKSTVELHVRATGVQSSHGEPFDGNIAVVIAAGDRTVDGRAEILRIGERHLVDLLDMEDPTRVDPATNRIRTLLNFGYPDRLHLAFDHGFASAHLELGGLARLVSISEIRGIPMGPIVDRFLGPMFDTEGKQ